MDNLVSRKRQSDAAASFCAAEIKFELTFPAKAINLYRVVFPDTIHIEAWLSLVERCVRDAEVVGSNPVASTQVKVISQRMQLRWLLFLCLSFELPDRNTFLCVTMISFYMQ